MAKAGRGSDQFPLRLPDGLRDRIKAYAEKHGRSMNAEIVRILEREFPEPWPVEARINQLLEMMSLLQADFGEARLENFVENIEATVRGIVSGRVKGLDVETRERIRHLYESWQEAEHEADADRLSGEYDDEELEAIQRTGLPEKFIEPFEDDK